MYQTLWSLALNKNLTRKNRLNALCTSGVYRVQRRLYIKIQGKSNQIVPHWIRNIKMFWFHLCVTLSSILFAWFMWLLTNESKWLNPIKSNEVRFLVYSTETINVKMAAWRFEKIWQRIWQLRWRYFWNSDVYLSSSLKCPLECVVLCSLETLNKRILVKLLQNDCWTQCTNFSVFSSVFRISFSLSHRYQQIQL